MSNIKFSKASARMAIIMGVFLPVAETIRRVNQLMDLQYFMSWFDDYLLGAILFISAWRVLLQKKNSLSFLIAAWGIGTGAVFLSFIGQFNYFQTGIGDPGIFATSLVAFVKGTILVYMITGLWFSIKAADLR